ncbi:hypothetical protein ABI59_15960 [Acidobacteria bacterium Mor1]|nr:hypothetical protein ABI59_15960 [Acidobacteria bacterium Mor1]
MKRLILIAILCASFMPAAAQSFYLSVDVPTDLPATELPWTILRNDASVYSMQASFPPAALIDAVHREQNGDWLLSVESPTRLGGVAVEPRDVIRFDGTTYSHVLNGIAEGIPDGVGIDAVYAEGNDLILSFDAPVSLGAGPTFLPADLVRWSGAGSFTMEFSSLGAGIPRYADVTGADKRAIGRAEILLTFDAPTLTVGGDFMPGDVVAWDGFALTLFYSDAAWPETSRANALSLPAGAGEVPTLFVDKASPTELTISWEESCAVGGAEEYAIYRGDLGSWYSHAAFDCTDDDGLPLSETVPVDSDSYYYLVVPFNVDSEGYYGADSDGTARPMGTATCGPVFQEIGCP